MSTELWHYILDILKMQKKKNLSFWIIVDIPFLDDTLLFIHATRLAMNAFWPNLDLIRLGWTLYPSKSIKLSSPGILIQETTEK